jgi:hypothetical protein
LERLKRQLAKPTQERLKREDNLKTELRKVRGEDMNCMKLASLWVQWRAL